MDERGAAAEDVEIVAESRRYLVTGDAEGYAVWDLRGDAEVPGARFPAGVDGQDDAIETFERLNGLTRRGWVLTVLAWLVAVVGGLWLVYSLGYLIVSGIIVVSGDASFANDFLAMRLFGLFLPLSVIPNAFLVLVGLYVVVWMQLHSRRRGD